MDMLEIILHPVSIFAAYFGLEKLAVTIFHKLTPNKTHFDEGVKKKQAVIIDNAHDHEWIETLGISGILAMPNAILNSITKSLPGHGFFETFGINFAVLASLMATGDDILCAMIYSRTRKLARELEKKGYSVSTIHKFEGNWESLFQKMGASADKDTTTVLVYNGHGNINSEASVISGFEKKKKKSLEDYCWRLERREKPSFISKGGISDYELAYRLADLPGKKIAVLNSCQAGGFVDATNSLPEKKRNCIAIMASSGKHVSTKINSMIPSFRKFVAKDSDNTTVSEFFRVYTDKKQATAKKIDRIAHMPRCAPGRQIRL